MNCVWHKASDMCCICEKDPSFSATPEMSDSQVDLLGFYIFPPYLESWTAITAI